MTGDAFQFVPPPNAASQEGAEFTNPISIPSHKRDHWPKLRFGLAAWASIVLLLEAMGLSAISSPAADARDRGNLSNEQSDGTRPAEWSQAAFGPQHTAFNRFEKLLTPSNVGKLTLAWEAQVGVGLLYASPVVADGRVFIGSGDGRLYAFDAVTGATLWTGAQQDLFFVDSAATGHGLVFANSLYQTLLAYDAASGEIVWTSALTDVRASPTLLNGKLYVGSFDGTLAVLDAETGLPIWSAQGHCCVFDQAPVAAGGRVFQMRTDHTLTAYDATSGRELWKKPAFSVGTFAAANGMLFFNSYPDLVALDQATGAQIWTAPVLPNGSGAPAVADGLVFTEGAELTALDAMTGAVVWSAPAASAWGPTVANGVVYASSLNGEWDAFDARTGTLLWSVTTGSGCGGTCANAVPVVADGMLYLAGPDNFLRAYTVKQ